MKLSVYDVNGNKITSVDYRKELGLNLELKNFVVVGKSTIYIMELSYPFSIDNFGRFTSIKNLRNFSLLLFLVILLILTVYLHNSLAKPLTLLHQCIEKVNYRNTRVTIPLPLKRNDEVGDLGRKFDEMLRRLDASHQEQTEMIASISHDLKTPLTSILGYLERLQSGKITSQVKQQEYHGIIFQKARDMKELIDEFAEYAFSDASRDSLTLDKVNLQTFFADLLLEYSAELEGHGIAFTSINEIPDQTWVMMDIAKIRRVIANLVQNSIKHAEGFTRLSMGCNLRHSMAIFTVEDNGRGVPIDELSVIFNKFYRLDKSRSRDKGGSGLGLAICRSIIENHGGNIEALPAEGGGLKIEFSLPLAPTL